MFTFIVLSSTARRALMVFCSLLPIAIVPLSASAQESGSQRSSAANVMLEEIMVTARRKDRAEDLQSIPVAVSAFSSDQLDAMQFSGLLDVTSRVPNANAEPNGTYPGYVNFNIRGTGVRGSALSDEPTVGIFVDGVYQGIGAGIMFDTFDMESVEILRGPQGTLFGRNVTGGAVLMRTSMPSEEFSAKVKAMAGNLGSYSLAGVVTGPIVEDKLLGKIAVFYNQRDDYVTNINKGNPFAPNAADLGEKDQLGVRVALTWLPSEKTEVTFRAEHMRADEDALVLDNSEGRFLSADGINGLFGALSPTGVVAPPFGDPYLTGGDVGAQVPHSEMKSASLDIAWQLGSGTLQSITAWRDLLQDDMQQDFDNSLAPLFEIWEHAINQDQISQEFVYNNSLTDALSITAGVYYFDQEITNNDFRISGGGFGGTGAHIAYAVDHSVIAAFASLDYDLTDNLILTVAGRFSDEEKSAVISNVGAFAASGGTVGCSADGILPTLVSGLNPVDSIDFSSCTPSFTGSKDWSNFSPKVGLQYIINDNTQVYGSFTRGFRSGGFSTRAQLGTDPLYNEEQVDAIEFGVKHTFASGGRLNAAVFSNKFDDMQRNIFLSIATGEQVTRNAAEATVNGAELEALLPVGDHFFVQASLGYNDATYDSYNDGVTDFSGKQLPSVSEWQRDLSLVYDVPIGIDSNLAFRAGYHFIDEFHNTDDNTGYLSPDRTTYDASISWSSSQWVVTAFGKNLTNETSQGPATDVSLWVVTTGYIPRTYGLQLTYSSN